jgi:uncharacterized protein with GYD domain
MRLYRATIRIPGQHDFVAEVRADDQIQALGMLRSMYGYGSIVGNCVYSV